MGNKAAVRAEAARLGLPVAEKPDSQDICFVPSGSYVDLLAKLRPASLAPGEIVDAAGVVLGAHRGLGRYTVGQSKGLGPASAIGGERQAVLALDPAGNRLTVGPRRAGHRTIGLRDLNWLVELQDEFRCEVKLRAREAPHEATIRIVATGVEVELDAPALAAPGQACVMYRGSQMLGGGFITARSGTTRSH